MSLIKFRGPDILTNGDFETGVISPWTTYKDPSVTATFGVDTAAPHEGVYNFKATITSGGIGTSYIQVGSMPYSAIVSAQRYRVAFAAKAQAARDITVLLRQHGTPFASYGLQETLGITTGWMVYTYDFAATVTAADARVIFYLGEDNNDVELDAIALQHFVDFARNPVYGGLGAPYGFRQPRDLSDGGVFYSYDKGVIEEFIELKWAMMPLADWTALDSFIRTEAEGAKNAFTYIDQDGAEHAVRLETTSVDFREVHFQRYAGSLILRKV